MAEHVRNELARAGCAVRPSRITTLAQFLEPLTPLAPAPDAALHLVIERALERLRPVRYAAVSEFPGFHSALATLLEEVPPETFSEDLARLCNEVQTGLAARGMALRHARLRAARPPGGPIVLDGFFSFSLAELDLIAALAAQSPVTVTLPDWPGASTAHRRLVAGGLTEHRLTATHRSARQSIFAAPTLIRECEEIARRILQHAANGRKFRDIGIILRARDPYATALETTLARFGIPARLYFADPLIAHPAVAYLSGVIDAMLGGWDHSALLALLRMPVSGVGATPAGDRFDFDLRERIPGAGLPIIGITEAPGVLDSFARLDAWRRERWEPAEWVVRLKTLRTLLPEPVINEPFSREQVRMWRSTAAALEAFDTALDATATALLGSGRIALETFWRQAALALALEPLRVPDRRHNVVHVMDVFEARQWELPVVFVCGLVERHFPQYHREDPIFNDAARRRAGLPTSADRQDDERFLFEFAKTRATAEVVLSYARFNDKGEEALPSFFLHGMEAAPCETRVRPRPLFTLEPARPAPIQDAALLDEIAHKHKSLAPTAIESFLQCPFQFFAARTLRLRRRPPAPRDRLDLLVQGSILHRALAELTSMPLLGAVVFDRVFEDECRRARIPATYRTEAVRLELLRHFEGYLQDRQVALGWQSRVEEKFSFSLTPLLSITGRIDRMDIGSGNRALVIDYKYSAGNKIRERVEENALGNLVQGGLYLLAAERQFGFEPAGMLYCGLRKDVVWGGWHAPIPGLERIGEVSTSAVLRELMNAAAARAAQTFESISTGRIEVLPHDTTKCAWCDFVDICRVESC